MTYIKTLRRSLCIMLLLPVTVIAFGEMVRAGEEHLPESDTMGNGHFGLFENVARLGENVLDLITWKHEDFVFTVYPAIGMNPRSGFVYGVMPALKWNSRREGNVNTITVNAEASTKGMKQLLIEHEWYFHEKWLARGKGFLDSREDRFWPAGENEDYYFDRREIRLNWFFLRNITRSLWIGGEVLMVRNRFPGEFEDGSPDFLNNSGGWVTGAGPSVMFDNRHRTLAPTKGALVEIAPLFAGTWGAGDHNYNRITVDARHYFPSFGDGSAMAFQFIFDYAGQDAPFYEIPQLGGKERLRGIGHPLRKTGNAVWLARGELRQPVWWRFGAVVFAGAGRASDGYNNPFDEVIGSFGGGLRFRILPDDPLNVRFDAGVSTMGTTGFYISLKEAF